MRIETLLGLAISLCELIENGRGTRPLKHRSLPTTPSPIRYDYENLSDPPIYETTTEFPT